MSRPRDTTPPFSLRLTFEERAELERAAGGQPLGAYVRDQLLGTRQRKRKKRRKPVKDDVKLAKLATMLGQTRIANNLNQMAHLAHTGSLPVTPETENALRHACAEVADMRRLLLEALGYGGGSRA